MCNKWFGRFILFILNLPWGQRFRMGWWLPHPKFRRKNLGLTFTKVTKVRLERIFIKICFLIGHYVMIQTSFIYSTVHLVKISKFHTLCYGVPHPSLSDETGPAKHFQIKWGQAYKLAKIAPPPPPPPPLIGVGLKCIHSEKATQF